MIRAAGILIVAKDGRALFLQRSPTSADHPAEWCFPGGHQEGDETAQQCAERECREEIGTLPEGEVRYLARHQSPDGVDFTTFVLRVDETFEPVLNDEHVGHAWVSIAAPPQPLLPGCAVGLRRLACSTELDVARMVADGSLTSPQQYENVWLFAMRITGTGVAYRHKWEEFVWRDPKLYMSQEFLDRCNGLPVIVDHPPTAVLDTKEFGKRVVGTIILPYLLPEKEEVWGVAKIYDAPIADLMSREQLSTSPSVVFRDPDVNNKLELENGEKLLIEGKPSLLDHLAICEQGVWDKGGEPSGVSSATIGEAAMADTPEEKRAAEDKARKDSEARAKADAEAGEKLDKLLVGLDAVCAKMDEHARRMDSIEDRLGKDDKGRKDSEEEPKDKKADDDDDDKGRKDAEGEPEGTPKPVAADKKRGDDDDDDDDDDKGRKDAEGEPEPKLEIAGDKKRGRKDSKRGRKDDDDDDDDDDDRGRKDSASSITDRIRSLESVLRPMSDEDRRKFADEQEKADAVFSAFGDSAPPPLQGEGLGDYRLRLASKLQQHSAVWKGVKLAAIARADAAAFDYAVSQIYADAMRASNVPTNLKPGQFVERVRTDSSTGRRTIEFYGSTSFVRQFAQPVRRVRWFDERRRREV